MTPHYVTAGRNNAEHSASSRKRGGLPCRGPIRSQHTAAAAAGCPSVTRRFHTRYIEGSPTVRCLHRWSAVLFERIVLVFQQRQTGLCRCWGGGSLVHFHHQVSAFSFEVALEAQHSALHLRSEAVLCAASLLPRVGHDLPEPPHRHVAGKLLPR